MKNKQGLTLIELLGAIVVFGILVSLSVMIISSFTNANNRANISSQANLEGLLAIRTIKNSMDDFEPTTYSICAVSDCLIVEKEYAYEHNEATNSIDLVVYDTPVEFVIKIESNILYVNDEAYVFDGFELTDDSNLEFEEIDSDLYITLTFYLTAGEEFTYEYILTYSYELSDVPES